MGRRNFSKEYKLQTTRQVIKEGKRIPEVSASLGITEQTIYPQLREYDKYPDDRGIDLFRQILAGEFADE